MHAMTNSYKPLPERLAQALAEVRKAGRAGINRNGLAFRCGVSAYHTAFLLRSLRVAGSVVVRGRNVAARWYVPELAPPVEAGPEIEAAERAAPTRAPRAKVVLDDEPDDELVTRPVIQAWVGAGEWRSDAPVSPAWVFHLA